MTITSKQGKIVLAF